MRTSDRRRCRFTRRLIRVRVNHCGRPRPMRLRERQRPVAVDPLSRRTGVASGRHSQPESPAHSARGFATGIRDIPHKRCSCDEFPARNMLQRESAIRANTMRWADVAGRLPTELVSARFAGRLAHPGRVLSACRIMSACRAVAPCCEWMHAAPFVASDSRRGRSASRSRSVLASEAASQVTIASASLKVLTTY